MEVEESFDVLFKNWDFENTEWILPLVRKCISLSPGEREVLRALEISLCFYLNKFSIEDLEEELLLTSCPAAKKMVVEKLSHLEKNPTGCVESVNVINKVLSYFERVFEYLNDIPKIAMIEVRSLLTVTSEILLSCFSHCKISEEVYGSLLSSLSECLSNFFKKCCGLQDQLLQFLIEKAEFDPEDDREIMLLDELMTSLSKLGIILIKLEAKTMAKVWKTFAVLIEKHIHCLKNNHDIGQTIKNLSNCIISNIETAIYRNNQEFSKTIKLSCFLLKLVIKFSEVFLECLQNCQNSVLNLLLMLCKFDVGLVSEEKFKTSMNQDLMNQLTIGTDPLLSQMINDIGFIKECCAVDEEVKKTIDFLVLCCLIIKKLMGCSSSTRNLWLTEKGNILEWIFLSASSSQFICCSNIQLPNILINGKQKKFIDLYEYVLVMTSAFLMTATAEEYSVIENTLIQNILQKNPNKALLATDIWCLLARFADSELCFSQIMILGEIFQEFHPQTLRVEKCYLASLIQRLFPLLAASHRRLFLKCFQPSFYAMLWDGPLLGELTPNEICDVQNSLLSEVNFLLDQDGSQNLDLEIPAQRQSTVYEKFGSKILKLFKFNCDILYSAAERIKFLKIICASVTCLIDDMPPDDLFLVLSQIKKLLVIGSQPTCIKLFFIWILNSLSAVSIPPGTSQRKIITTLADIFRELLSSKEPLTKGKAFESFYSFSHITSHGEVIAMSVQNVPQLKLEITNYFKRKPPDDADFDLNVWLSQLFRLKFEHVCLKLEPDGAVIAKKMKPNLSEIVIRWKETGKVIVEHFHSFTESEKREINNVCSSVLSLI